VARGVSADGLVVVGNSSGAQGGEAFRWTQAGGMTALGDLPGRGFFSIATGVSADGSVVVGFSDSGATLGSEAFRWTAASGMVGLGTIPGYFSSQALAVSADGSVVVGFSEGPGTPQGGEAFRWTEANGMVGLGDLPGGLFDSRALAVSADGSVIVGWSRTADLSQPTMAFLWDDVHGMRSVHDILTALGDDLTGWQLIEATGVSADGLTVVGYGRNPNGQLEGWVVHLNAVPEASSCLLAALGLTSLLGYAWRRKVVRRSAAGRVAERRANLRMTLATLEVRPR
jgi:probable HAF family extracellular repeat protein